MIVDHALGLPGGWDWPVRRAALEVVVRRIASARTQEIVVLDGPRRGAWGRYRLGRVDAAGVLRPFEISFRCATASLASAPPMPRIQGNECNWLRRCTKACVPQGPLRLHDEQAALAADDMGLGKTTQAIVAATVLYDAKLVRRGLLVVPAALKPQWEREWRALSAAPLRVVEGGAAERRALYRAVAAAFW